MLLLLPVTRFGKNLSLIIWPSGHTASVLLHHGMTFFSISPGSVFYLQFWILVFVDARWLIYHNFLWLIQASFVQGRAKRARWVQLEWHTSGQSYKHFMLVNYNSRAVIWGYFPVRYNSRVVIYEHKIFKWLATENTIFFIRRSIVVRLTSFFICLDSADVLMLN